MCVGQIPSLKFEKVSALPAACDRQKTECFSPPLLLCVLLAYLKQMTRAQPPSGTAPEGSAFLPAVLNLFGAKKSQPLLNPTHGIP